jgi:hypothetical protein
MRAKTGLSEICEVTALAIMLVPTSATMIGQQQPVVNRPSTSSVQVTPRQAPSPYGNAPNPAVRLQRAQGTITGYVYWQMNVLQPNSDCQGLTVKVITVNKSGMPLQLLASTNTLTAAGPLTDYSAQGAPKYMLCSFSFQNMPEHVSVRTLLYGPPSGSFVIPAAFQIPGDTCASTPQSTLSFILTAGETLCGDGAFNINFKLNSTAMARPPGSTAPLLNGSGKPQGMLSNPGTMSSPAATTATRNTISGTTLLPAQTDAAGSMTPSGQTGLLSGAKSGVNGNSTAAIGGTGGYTGTTKPGEKAPGPGGLSGGIKPVDSTASTTEGRSWMPGAPITSANFVPKMPPISSNAKRDASQPADAAEKMKMRSQVKAQLLAAHQRTGQRNSVLTVSHANVPEIQALQQQLTFVSSLRTQGALTKNALLVSQNPNVRMKPPGSSSPMLNAPPPAKFCPGPQIHAVNGKTSGVVFTQDPQYNDYIITGCGFGTQEGQVYLSGAIANGRINMAVKPGAWSDTQIEAMFLSGLTGVRDGWPDLIVAPVTGSPAKLPNARFYAQRQSVLLPYIPQQYANLANVPVGDGKPGSGTMYCPGPDLMKLFPCIAFNAGVKLDGMTNGVDHRNDTNSFPVSNAVDREGGRQQFNSGEDTFDLSYMAPGFEIDYSTVFWYAWTSDVCEGWASDAFPKKPGDSVAYDTEGYYNWQDKTKTKIVVGWGVDHCAWRWLGIFRVDDWYNSGYSLQVHVIGPIGVDPWTGLPVPKSPNFKQAQPRTLKTLP